MIDFCKSINFVTLCFAKDRIPNPLSAHLAQQSRSNAKAVLAVVYDVASGHLTNADRLRAELMRNSSALKVGKTIKRNNMKSSERNDRPLFCKNSKVRIEW